MEGPALAKHIFTSSNVGTEEGRRFVAQKLLELGYKPGVTSAEDGANLYKDYLTPLVLAHPSLEGLYNDSAVALLVETVESALDQALFNWAVAAAEN